MRGQHHALAALSLEGAPKHIVQSVGWAPWPVCTNVVYHLCGSLSDMQVRYSHDKEKTFTWNVNLYNVVPHKYLTFTIIPTDQLSYYHTYNIITKHITNSQYHKDISLRSVQWLLCFTLFPSLTFRRLTSTIVDVPHR